MMGEIWSLPGFEPWAPKLVRYIIHNDSNIQHYWLQYF